MKNLKTLALSLMTAALAATCLTGCGKANTEAAVQNERYVIVWNVEAATGEEAEETETVEDEPLVWCYQHITVWNAQTDMVLYEREGYMNISRNDDSELVITTKTGEDTCDEDRVYLNEHTMYVVEDTTEDNLVSIENVK